MPNPPSERSQRPREPHARRPGTPATGRPPGHAAGSLKTPAGVGLAIVALIAVGIAFAGFMGGPAHDPNSVAIAGATTIPSDPASASDGPVVPTGAASPSAPPASAEPGPTSTPSPAPTATPLPSPSPRDPLVGVPVARLEKAVNSWRAKTGIPGLSVAIVWDDGRAWAGAAGKADIASKRAMTTGTGFAFASVSKMFTSAVVQDLIREGKVHLDQPAADFLPEFRLDRRITVRMLMDHRSSLPDFFSNAKIDRALQRHKNATWTAAQAWKYVPKWRPTPGSIYDYSNTNYLLLGRLVEHVTGNPLAVEIRNRVLDPLELNTAWYQGAETPRAEGATPYRVTRVRGGSRATPVAKPSTMMPFRSVVTAAGGAGSIAGTATDAARFVQAYGSGRLQGPKMYREMVEDSKFTKAMHAIVTYGLGIQVITIEGQKTLGHSGRYLGYQNTVRYLPQRGIAIAILTNQSTWDPAILLHELIRIVAPK